MIAQLSASVVHLIQFFGYGGVFVLMTLESALIPIPSEVTMSFAGYLVGQGALNYYLVVLAGTLGNVVGSLVSYYIGHTLHKRGLIRFIHRYGRYMLLTAEDYEQSAAWFAQYGSAIAFFSRLLQGVRTFISLPAGVSQMNIWKFSAYTFAGSLVWSAALTSVGAYLGSNWDTIGPIFREFQYAIAGIVFLLFAYFVFKKVSKSR